VTIATAAVVESDAANACPACAHTAEARPRTFVDFALLVLRLAPRVQRCAEPEPDSDGMVVSRWACECSNVFHRVDSE
jgi:hypothetical protein